MLISSVLTAGRKLITNPDNWTKGTAARDRYGREVEPDSPSAVQWDSNGALAVAGPPYKRARLLLHIQMKPGITAYNDLHPHKEVLAAWDRAIVVAKFMQD